MTSRSYVPTVEEVGALIHARTKDVNGNYLGTFTTATQPTSAQVQDLIAKSANRIREFFGGEIAEALALSAREVVAMRVATLIELSYFGEQIQAGRSPYNELKTQHDEAWAALILARSELDAAEQPGLGEGEGSPNMPAFWFPPPDVSWHGPGTTISYPLPGSGWDA